MPNPENTTIERAVAAEEERRPSGLRDSLLRVAVHAAAEGDIEFLDACERRWARTFAPDGPRLIEVIGASLEELLPEEEELTLGRRR